MGMFDRVWVNCPHCGAKNELQSKAGECILADYDIYDAPPPLQADVAGIHWCEKCDDYFHVVVQTIVGVVPYYG